MNLINPVLEWTTTLRHLAAGATIAAVILVPPVAPPTISIQSGASGRHLRLVTSIPDGGLDPRMIRFRTRVGLGTDYLLPETPEDGEEEPALLPMRLREVSGLPVTMLAQLTGVSKVTYHNWLKGEGISEANASRLADLLDVLHPLRELRGAGLGDFLGTRGPLGRPIELLQDGDFDTVLGLALLPVSTELPPPVIADANWAETGLGGWIQPVARLNWGAPHLGNEELGRVLREVNPHPGRDDDLALDDDEESPFVTYVQFVS